MTGAQDFAYGLENGFPVCCILDFIADSQHGRSPATQRAGSIAAGGHYVSCRRCDAKGLSTVPPVHMQQWFFPLELEVELWYLNGENVQTAKGE